MINIYTSYFSNKNIPQEYQCISVANTQPSRSYPKWREVIPSWFLAKSFKSKEISFELFRQIYLNQLIRKSLADSYNFELYLNCLDNENIVLLCWEKDYNNCHRKVLVEYLTYFYTDLRYIGEI